MSDEEMQQHIKRKAALEKKRRQMEDQDSDMVSFFSVIRFLFFALL